MTEFSAIPCTPTEHFKRCYYAAVLHVIEQAAQSYGAPDALFEHFPFLAGYGAELSAELMQHDLAAGDLSAARTRWIAALGAWEAGATGHLPLLALRTATGLDYAALTMLMTVGLLEEDPRFGLLFEALQTTPGQHRPTVGLLSAWWPTTATETNARTTLRQLQTLGLVEVVNPEAPRSEWALQVPALLWDVARGETQAMLAAWARYLPPAQLTPLDHLILPPTVQQSLPTLPTLLATGAAQAIVVRGPQHNGRRTLVGALAASLGCGLLTIDGTIKPNDARWRLVGPLATMLPALPLVVYDLAPGETIELVPLTGYGGPLGVVLGKQGGLHGAVIEQAITLTLDIPTWQERQRHWGAGAAQTGNALADEVLAACSARFRMTSGNIRRVAQLARTYAAGAKRATFTLADAQQAHRALNRQALETLAAAVPPLTAFADPWQQLAVSATMLDELHDLASRCRHRERLRSAVGVALGEQLNAGVRVLFSGPSGTGKTLAARVLAAALNMDLYRLDLSAVVNKYIGETEKNLSQVFARAEALDVILLLDEGDALLTNRTSVTSSNDRYANLETNYLLQRLESYEGILLVTTNAGQRIDGAFQRRMDVVVEFRPPDSAERQLIWQLHLPPAHAIDAKFLSEVAIRCPLTGGQIRNAALHAGLLALNNGGVVTTPYLESAVQREYRKTGAVCPLRRPAPLAGLRG